MPKYLMIVEQVEDMYSAYLPDVPGCVATGRTQEEAAQNLRAALKLHLEEIREDPAPIPESRTSGDYIMVE